MENDDRVFAGSVPEIYERHLVPLIFEVYADDIVRRVAERRPSRVLEIAAGTGVVTRRLATAPPPDVAIVATDLSQGMLDRAMAAGTSRPVEWRQADAMELPFPDGSFDAVVCQFGVMFFPDRSAAYAECRRVLRPGGLFAFNVWGRVEDNDFADITTKTLAKAFPADPPRFLARVPYGYHDAAVITEDLSRGGFSRAPAIETVTHRSRAESARGPAIGYCQGNPIRGEIEARGSLGDATDLVAAAIVARFGSGALDTQIRAEVVTILA